MKWSVLIIIYFITSDVSSEATVEQPAMLTAALGQDKVLPCHLKVSPGDRITNQPVLYWIYQKDNIKLWEPTGKYHGRVKLVDQNPDSLIKSIIFKRVEWEDKGKYQCKVSVTTQQNGSLRKKGTETELLVYGQIFFNITSHNKILLQCEVYVTHHPRFDLSISHNGQKLQTLNSTPVIATTSLPYVTLSQTVALRSLGKYECELNFNGDLLSTSVFHYEPSDGLSGLFDGNESVTMSEEVVFPEPWPLYGGLILVPAAFFLVLLIAMLGVSC